VFSRHQLFLIPAGAAAFAAACDPNVVIGARLSLAEAGAGAQVATAGTTSDSGSGGANGGSAGAGGSSAGSEATAAGASGDGGVSSAGAGGEPGVAGWCATSPVDGTSATFTSDGGTVIPAGAYSITYISGAQIHDADIGYEVTRHYYLDGLEAGHHVYGGDSPQPGTSIWLDEVGIVGAGSTIAEIEALNYGHVWPYEHAGGELHVVLFDNDYRDNKGGTRFCVVTAP
jgi:hypothetical protein